MTYERNVTYEKMNRELLPLCLSAYFFGFSRVNVTYIIYYCPRIIQLVCVEPWIRRQRPSFSRQANSEFTSSCRTRTRVVPSSAYPLLLLPWEKKTPTFFFYFFVRGVKKEWKKKKPLQSRTPGIYIFYFDLMPSLRTSHWWYSWPRSVVRKNTYLFACRKKKSRLINLSYIYSNGDCQLNSVQEKL
jgi:hypothetical protein